jgi:hypothetical protein
MFQFLSLADRPSVKRSKFNQNTEGEKKMKKLMTLVLVCIMAFTCSFSAMAEPKDASQNNLVVDEEVASELAR